MSHSHRISPRSILIAGMSAAVVGAAAVTPVSAPAPSPMRIAAAVEMTSLASGLGGVIDNLNTFSSGIQGVFTNLGTGIGAAYDNLTGGIENVIASLTATINRVTSLPDGVQAALKNTYDGLERWPRYVSAWTQFSLGLVPGLWYLAPAVAFAYNTAQPLARAGAYSFADIIGLDFAQFTRDIRDGIRTSAENAAIYGKLWADSFVAVPTLPPYPGPWPGANVINPLPAASAEAATLAAPEAAAVTSGIETAIKNTYNAVEPWVAWGFELAQWGLGFVPGLWWVAPGISLGYFTIEPLVQAGVYTIADVLGLNFAQIGPDIQQGVQESAQNAVTYALAWLQSLIPFPPLPPFPPRPGAAVAATSTPLAAAAAAPAALETAPETAAPSSAPAGDDAHSDAAQTDVAGQDSTDEGTAGDDAAPAVGGETPAPENTAPENTTPETPGPETPAPDAAAPESPDPAVEADAAVADQGLSEAVADAVPVAEPKAEVPAADDAVVDNTTQAPKTVRGALPGHRSPVGATAKAGAADDGSAGADNGESPKGRSSR